MKRSGLFRVKASFLTFLRVFVSVLSEVLRK
jgi:hypothetical protein